jgi:hypothetical protein
VSAWKLLNLAGALKPNVRIVSGASSHRFSAGEWRLGYLFFSRTGVAVHVFGSRLYGHSYALRWPADFATRCAVLPNFRQRVRRLSTRTLRPDTRTPDKTGVPGQIVDVSRCGLAGPAPAAWHGDCEHRVNARYAWPCLALLSVTQKEVIQRGSGLHPDPQRTGKPATARRKVVHKMKYDGRAPRTPHRMTPDARSPFLIPLT